MVVVELDRCEEIILNVSSQLALYQAEVVYGLKLCQIQLVDVKVSVESEKSWLPQERRFFVYFGFSKCRIISLPQIFTFELQILLSASKEIIQCGVTLQEGRAKVLWTLNGKRKVALWTQNHPFYNSNLYSLTTVSIFTFVPSNKKLHAY